MDGNDGDGDNPERLGPISLTVPDGVQLLNGADVLITGGTVKIFLSDAPGGYHTATAQSEADVVLTTEQYQALKVNPVPQSHENFNVTVSMTEYEVDDEGNQLSGVSGMTTTVNIPVDVKAVTDPVDLKIDGGDHKTPDKAYDLTIHEDEEFKLGGDGGLLSASSDDTADGSETGAVRITNPAGNADIVVSGDKG